MDIYVDIDGVLLANENNLANYAEEFIEYLVNNYTVYWLTTHCMDNDASLAVQNVGRFCKPEIVELLHKIKPTSWKVAKTEAIDFSQPFLWIDDDLPKCRHQGAQYRRHCEFRRRSVIDSMFPSPANRCVSLA